jgi:hypothetical protein
VYYSISKNVKAYQDPIRMVSVVRMVRMVAAFTNLLTFPHAEAILREKVIEL